MPRPSNLRRRPVPSNLPPEAVLTNAVLVLAMFGDGVLPAIPILEPGLNIFDPSAEEPLGSVNWELVKTVTLDDYFGRLLLYRTILTSDNFDTEISGFSTKFTSENEFRMSSVVFLWNVSKELQVLSSDGSSPLPISVPEDNNNYIWNFDGSDGVTITIKLGTFIMSALFYFADEDFVLTTPSFSDVDWLTGQGPPGEPETIDVPIHYNALSNQDEFIRGWDGFIGDGTFGNPFTTEHTQTYLLANILGQEPPIGNVNRPPST